MVESISDIQRTELSRRAFLKGILGVATGAMIGTALATSTEDRQASADSEAGQSAPESYLINTAAATTQPSEGQVPQINTPPPGEITQPTSNNSEEGGYIDTTVRSVGVGGLVLASSYLAQKTNLRIGNALFMLDPKDTLTKDERIRRSAGLSRRDVLKFMLVTGVGTPLVEESIFRLIPSKLCNGLGAEGKQWPVGVATSALFAATHARDKARDLTTVPLIQFGAGMFLWGLQRDRGFTHNALGHMINNGVNLAPSFIGYEMARRKYPEETPEARQRARTASRDSRSSQVTQPIATLEPTAPIISSIYLPPGIRSIQRQTRSPGDKITIPPRPSKNKKNGPYQSMFKTKR